MLHTLEQSVQLLLQLLEFLPILMIGKNDRIDLCLPLAEGLWEDQIVELDEEIFAHLVDFRDQGLLFFGLVFVLLLELIQVLLEILLFEDELRDLLKLLLALLQRGKLVDFDRAGFL